MSRRKRERNVSRKCFSVYDKPARELRANLQAQRVTDLRYLRGHRFAFSIVALVLFTTTALALRFLDEDAKRRRAIGPTSVQASKATEPDKQEIVVPLKVKSMASTPTGATITDETVILPTQMIRVKQDLARVNYQYQAEMEIQNSASRLLLSLQDPEPSEIRKEETNVQPNTQFAEHAVGASVSRDGALIALEMETNRLIVNYVNANADANGNLKMKVRGKDGTIITANFTRKNVVDYLKSFVKTIRSIATCNVAPNDNGCN